MVTTITHLWVSELGFNVLGDLLKCLLFHRVECQRIQRQEEPVNFNSLGKQTLTFLVLYLITHPSQILCHPTLHITFDLLKTKRSGLPF